MTSVARLDTLATLPTLPKAAQLHGWRRTWFRFRQRKSALVALGFVIVMVLIAVLAPVLAPADPAQQNLQDRFAGFSGNYWLGTDDLGRDLASRMMFGLRTSLLACLLAVSIALTLGFVIGVLSGYVGGFVDALLMRLIDGILAVPGLLLLMAIVGVLGPGLRNAMIGLSVLFTPTFARLVRGQVLSTKSDVYVEAARVMGAKDSRIVFRHIVPNSMAPIIVQGLMTMGFALLAEGTLSYLGLSIKPPGTSLGTLLQRGFSYKERSQSMILLPGIAITLLSWAFNVIADGLRDAIGRQEIGGGA
ncbi:MAG TPA: ABC transporter permease [Acidimicrobiales bacterium]|nr:ABC transporter permease [Acidimicrobiales bacterium]